MNYIDYIYKDFNSGCLSELYREFDCYLWEGNFKKIESILETLEINKIALEYLLGLLTILDPCKDSIVNYNNLLETTKKVYKNHKDFDSIFKGFQ